MRVSRTLSDDIKYIYDCVSRVIGPRIFLAILSLPPSLPSLSLTLLLFYFSLGLRRPQAAQERRDPRYLASFFLHTETSSSFSFSRPPPSLDRLPIIRSKGHPALPDAANEKNHREGGWGGEGESILSCRPLFSPRFFNWNIVRGVYVRFEG